ncbi:MAG: hypothetical protein ACFE8J_07505 [Candidatus Heimdallarchaeota archaeon]
MTAFSIKVVSVVALSAVLIFSAPLMVFIIIYSDLDIIKEKLYFDYTPETPHSRVQLNLYADVGNIEIKYLFLPNDKYVQTDIDLEIAGLDLKDKTYLHFFNISWIEANSSVELFFLLKPDIFEEFSNLMMKDINLVVALKADIVFDINATTIQGDIEYQAEYGIHTGYINMNINTGNILYDLSYCIIEGNLSGVVGTGNIEFRTYNEKYTQNTNWNFTVETGNIDLYITQDVNPAANVTSTVKVNNGDVFFFYEDKSADVGARFDIYFDFIVPDCLESSPQFENCSFIIGFHYTVPDLTPEPDDNHIVTSWDIIYNDIKNYYDIIFDIIQKPVIHNCYATMKLESIPYG